MKKQQGNAGIGFLGLLTILFVGLKLTGYINWSWWLVLVPLYGPLAVVLALLAIAAIIATLTSGD
jgi:hypothetical protein